MISVAKAGGLGASDASDPPAAITEARVFSYEARVQQQMDLVSRLRQQVGVCSISVTSKPPTRVRASCSSGSCC